MLDYILRQLKRRIDSECRKIPDKLFDVGYADDTALVAECMDRRILELTGLPGMEIKDQHKEDKDHADHKE